MAEIKNLFVKSKMNKDLDARLLTNGEYRDAQNISVSKSEGADVGAVLDSPTAVAESGRRPSGAAS